MNANLKLEMFKAKISQQQLATLLGKDRKLISNRINGRTNWQWEEIEIIRNEFFPNLTLDYLFKPETK